MANKKIKKIQLSEATYEICDANAVHSINGYSYAEIDDGTVQFADTPIDEDTLIKMVGDLNPTTSDPGSEGTT